MYRIRFLFYFFAIFVVEIMHVKGSKSSQANFIENSHISGEVYPGTTHNDTLNVTDPSEIPKTSYLKLWLTFQQLLSPKSCGRSASN